MGEQGGDGEGEERGKIRRIGAKRDLPFKGAQAAHEEE